MTTTPTEKTIIVGLERYKALLQSEKELTALHAGGVDNWEWYGDSLREAGCFEDEEEDGA